MLNKLGGKWMNSKNFNKELENMLKNLSELKNTVVKMKNILEDTNSRLGDIEEHKENLEDGIVEMTQQEQEKKEITIT